jgi:hypothetical protein
MGIACGAVVDRRQCPSIWSPRRSQDGRIGLLAAKTALSWRRSAAVSGWGSIVIAPTELRTHRFADGIEEGSTGVRHQMPPICDLAAGPCRRFAVSSITVTGYDRDRGIPSSLAVRRADGANTPSAKRLVKIWRKQSTTSQRKRRAITKELYESGRLVTRRRYRLWTCRETVPHDGPRPTLPEPGPQ